MIGSVNNRYEIQMAAHQFSLWFSYSTAGEEWERNCIWFSNFIGGNSEQSGSDYGTEGSKRAHVGAYNEMGCHQWQMSRIWLTRHTDFDLDYIVGLRGGANIEIILHSSRQAIRIYFLDGTFCRLSMSHYLYLFLSSSLPLFCWC